MEHDPYYRDVCIDNFALPALPSSPTDVSPSLHHSNTSTPTKNQPSLDFISDRTDCSESNTNQTSSFVASVSNTHTDLEEIEKYLHPPNIHYEQPIEWTPIVLSPVIEYNTDGLFSMAFPTLFPRGLAIPSHPRFKSIEMQDYALHFL